MSDTNDNDLYLKLFNALAHQTIAETTLQIVEQELVELEHLIQNHPVMYKTKSKSMG